MRALVLPGGAAPARHHQKQLKQASIAYHKLACVAGVRKGRGRELERETLPPSFLARPSRFSRD